MVALTNMPQLQCCGDISQRPPIGMDNALIISVLKGLEAVMGRRNGKHTDCSCVNTAAGSRFSPFAEGCGSAMQPPGTSR